jgi:hypothetical protein
MPKWFDQLTILKQVEGQMSNEQNPKQLRFAPVASLR